MSHTRLVKRSGKEGRMAHNPSLPHRLTSVIRGSGTRLYGREPELALLKDAVQRARRGKSSKPRDLHEEEEGQQRKEEGRQRPLIVLVAGESGSGKSALLEAAFAGNGNTILYGSGKFDEDKLMHQKPYAALINCLSQICDDMALHDEGKLQHEKQRKLRRKKFEVDGFKESDDFLYGKALRRHLATTELATLTTFLPDLEKVLSISNSVSDDEDAKKELPNGDDNADHIAPLVRKKGSLGIKAFGNTDQDVPLVRKKGSLGIKAFGNTDQNVPLVRKKGSLGIQGLSPPPRTPQPSRSKTPPSSRWNRSSAPSRRFGSALPLLCFGSSLPQLISQKSTNSQRTASSNGSQRHDSVMASRRISSFTSTTKLAYAIQCFLVVIARPERPVVLNLDDLQWSDSSSLAILQSVLMSSNLHNIVIAGSYRDNECSDEHPFIQWVANTQQKSGLSVETMTIGDLSPHSVERLLMDLLKAEHTKELATIIHGRTNGNVFHVLELVDHLQAQGMMSYSKTSFGWKWDIDRIRDETTLSDNVVAIVGMKLHNMPYDLQTCLKLCSCLGSRFDKSVLSVIQDALPEIGDMDACLKTAQEEGLLEMLSDNNRLKFVHDRVLKAATQLFENEAARVQAHLTIGQLLWESNGQITTFSEDQDLFLCTDQLNRGRELITDQEFKIKLAILNYEAAIQAAKYSAFFQACSFLEVGIGLLNPTVCWTENYDLSLELHSCLAEMCSKAGQIAKQSYAVEEVLKHSKSVRDAIRVHSILLKQRLAETQHQNNIQATLSDLKLFGETIPRKPSKWYKNRMFRQTKKQLFEMSDEDILSLPVMYDGMKEVAVQALSTLAQQAYNTGNHCLATVCVSRAVQLTLNHGVAPYSSFAMSWLSSMAISEQDDVDAGYKLSKLPTAMQQQCGSIEPTGRDTVITCSVLQWREPLSHVLDVAIEGYRNGMRSGDMFSMCYNITVYCYSYFFSGLPIEPLRLDMKNYIHLMMEYNQKFWVLMNVPLYQCLLNLAGRSNCIVNLSCGKAKEFRDILGWDDRAGEESEWSYKMQLAVYCEDLPLATELADKLMKIPPGSSRSFAYYHTRVFFFAIISLWNCKKRKRKTTNRWEYRWAFKKYFNMMNEWVMKKRAINLVHKLLILKAERLSMRRRRIDPRDLSDAYDKAISSSIRSGFLQDAALAAHLASRCRKLEVYDRKAYHERALELYSSWGAHGIVDYLQTHIGSRSWSSYDSLTFTCMESTTERTCGSSYHGSPGGSGGYRARERFDKTVVDEHKKNLLASTLLYRKEIV